MNNAYLIFGTFSLMTKAHLEMGLLIKRNYIFDNNDIFYIPAPKTYIEGYKKDIFHISDEKRVEILKNTVEPFGMKVSTVEIDGVVSGYTYDTVEYFKKQYDNVYICVGQDVLEDMINWEKGLELMKENSFIIYSRGEVKKNDYTYIRLLTLKDILVLDNQYNGYSSSLAKVKYYNKDFRSLMDIVVPETYIYLMEVYKNEQI